MCYFYALFQNSKQFYSAIIINTIWECKNTFKLSTCLIYVLKACYDNSRRQRKIFYACSIDMKNDRDRWDAPKLCFLLWKRKVVQNTERRKSVHIGTKHCHYKPYSPKAFISL